MNEKMSRYKFEMKPLEIMYPLHFRGVRGGRERVARGKTNKIVFLRVTSNGGGRWWAGGATIVSQTKCDRCRVLV